jgi:hypothetical protein
MCSSNQSNPKLDLSFERIVDVLKELAWKAWTPPVILMPWLGITTITDFKRRTER